MTMIRCEHCGSNYDKVIERHTIEVCLAFVMEERDRLRSFVAAGGPDARQSELRDVLFRTENERRMLLDALTQAQKRSTELLEETRALRREIESFKSGVALNGPCGDRAPGRASPLTLLYCDLPWGHKGWHRSGVATWTHGSAPGAGEV